VRGRGEVGEDAAVERLETTLLRGREVGGHGVGAQRGERVAEAREALLVLVGARRQRRAGRCRARHA